MRTSRPPAPDSLTGKVADERLFFQAQALVKQKPDRHLWEYRLRFLNDLGVHISESVICRGLQLLRLTMKNKTRQVMLSSLYS